MATSSELDCRFCGRRAKQQDFTDGCTAMNRGLLFTTLGQCSDEELRSLVEDGCEAAKHLLKQRGAPLEAPCAFGPEGKHHEGELVRCDVCGRPTCDHCGFGHNDEEEDWLCPDHAPEGQAGT